MKNNFLIRCLPFTIFFSFLFSFTIFNYSYAENNECCILQNNSNKNLYCHVIGNSAEKDVCTNEYQKAAQFNPASPGNQLYTWWKNEGWLSGLALDTNYVFGNVIGNETVGSCSECPILGAYDWTVVPGVNSIEAGDSLPFSIKIEDNENISSGILSLVCDNCIDGITKVVNSSSIDPENDITVNYLFDSAAYIKTKQPNLPVSLNFDFTANNGISKEVRSFFVTINAFDCQKLEKKECNTKLCLWGKNLGNGGQCISVQNDTICSNLTILECPNSDVCALDKDNKCALKQVVDAGKAVDAIIKSEHSVPPGYTGPLPDCAFYGFCRDVNDFVDLGLRVMDYIFSIVAGLAFVMFIYGGFTWIFSFGNSEKVKKGQQIFVYAVIGLVIVFSAYILVGFLLDALNVSKTFRGIT